VELVWNPQDATKSLSQAWARANITPEWVQENIKMTNVKVSCSHCGDVIENVGGKGTKPYRLATAAERMHKSSVEHEDATRHLGKTAPDNQDVTVSADLSNFTHGKDHNA
jgi:hypothetical protein